MLKTSINLDTDEVFAIFRGVFSTILEIKKVLKNAINLDTDEVFSTISGIKTQCSKPQ